MSTIDAQLGHRTIREFKDQAVPEETLSTLFEVAMRTATSRGFQQAGIIRITDPDLREKLTEIGKQEYVRRAPVHLIFIVDAARNARILEEAGLNPEDAARTQNFVEGFTDACLMAQNVVAAAESLGLGANYLGNIHNDTAAVVDALQLPKYTFPVVGLTLGWPNQEPQLKPRMEQRFRVMENGYQAPVQWSEALSDYDAEMTTYYDLRDANRRVDSFTNQITAKLPHITGKQDHSLEVATAQGFNLLT